MAAALTRFLSRSTTACRSTVTPCVRARPSACGTLPFASRGYGSLTVRSTPTLISSKACVIATARVASAGCLRSSAMPEVAANGVSMPVRCISVKRRRTVKMNKHKYEKLKKRMRRLTAKNLKGNAK